MKDQNTPTNTPDPIEMLYIESPSITLKQFREAISKEVSQAVNKARIDEIRRYDHMTYHSREEHDTYLQDRIAELNRDETPNQTEGETSPLGDKV